MLTRIEQAEKKWGGINKLIDSWLSERKDLLVRYCKLAALPPFERPNHSLPEFSDIKAFCELLMDYASTGHFELYDKILEECSPHSKDEESVQAITSKIKATTDTALSFNDNYAELSEKDDMADFVSNLTMLGEELEERFELEDQLLETFNKPSN